MSNKIEKLKEVLKNLPTLTEKLSSWRILLGQIDKEERESLESCIKELEFEMNSVSDFESYLSLCESFKGQVKSRIKELTDRLEIPITAYKEKIYELQTKDFKVRCSNFRVQEDLRLKQHALNLAKKYKEDYKPSYNQYNYLNQCDSMVTGFLFQPGIYPCKNQAERDCFYEIFKGFDPQSYCAIFRKELRRLFA
jgi:hypothetical protein